MLVAESTVTAVAATPAMVTEAPCVKFVPVIVTASPPLVSPFDGEIPVTVGTGGAGAAGVVGAGVGDEGADGPAPSQADIPRPTATTSANAPGRPSILMAPSRLREAPASGASRA